jgi:hypothetical protein
MEKLHHNAYRDELAAHGFVVATVLDSKELQYLNQLCEKFLQQPAADFSSSSHFLNREDSELINRALHEILQPKVEIMFPDLELLGGTLATKKKGKSAVEAHQDWTIVDETRFNSFNLWIPLVDTNKENGTLGLIPGSHRWNNVVRGYSTPNPYAAFTDKLMQIGYEPELSAGQAILYNHKLLHYSRPNRTDQHRNTAIVGMKEKNADLQVSVFSSSEKKIDTYAVTEEDFYLFNPDLVMKTRAKINSSVAVKGIGWKEIYDAYSGNFTAGKYTKLQLDDKSFVQKVKQLAARLLGTADSD